MKLFLNNKEVTITELKSALDNVEPWPDLVEAIILTEINADGDLFFENCLFNAFD